MNNNSEQQFDGYISSICVDGKCYKLKCEVVEVYPMICPKCGGQLELKYGYGKCGFCGTNFATNFKVEEIN